MRRCICFVLAVTMIFTLGLQASAMDNHILTLEKGYHTVKLSAELLEQQLGLEQDSLLSLKVLQIPQNGQLISAGVPVENGETLLRWELEELYYLPDGGEKDWFAIVPQCSKSVCAVINITK